MEVLIRNALEVLKDVRTEIQEPEVAELITLKLDKKVDDMIDVLQEYLDGESI